MFAPDWLFWVHLAAQQTPITSSNASDPNLFVECMTRADQKSDYKENPLDWDEKGNSSKINQYQSLTFFRDLGLPGKNKQKRKTDDCWNYNPVLPQPQILTHLFINDRRWWLSLPPNCPPGLTQVLKCFWQRSSLFLYSWILHKYAHKVSSIWIIAGYKIIKFYIQYADFWLSMLFMLFF